MQKEAELPIYPSMKAASARTGLPLSFLKRCKGAGCPAFDLHGRMDLNKLLPWIPTVMDSKEELPTGFDSWTTYLNSLKAKREDIRLQKERGETMTIADATGQATEAESFYFAELDRLQQELPPVLAGLPAQEIYDRISKRLEELKKTSRERFKIKPEETK